MCVCVCVCVVCVCVCVCLSTSTRGRKLCSVSSVAQLIHLKISHKAIFSMSLMCVLQLHGIVTVRADSGLSSSVRFMNGGPGV